MDRIKGVNSECDRTPIVNPARWCPYHRFHADAVAALFAQARPTGAYVHGVRSRVQSGKHTNCYKPVGVVGQAVAGRIHVGAQTNIVLRLATGLIK